MGLICHLIHLISTRECHGYEKPVGKRHGLPWGTGTGSRNSTPEKPVPEPRVRRVWSDLKLRSKARETASSAKAQHSKLYISTHHNHHLPRNHEQDRKGGGMGGASTHFLTRYVVYWTTNYDLWLIYRIQVVPHPTTLENERACSFLMAVGCPSLPLSHHPHKRARALVFDGGWLSVITTIPPPLKMSTHACFWWWLAVPHHYHPIYHHLTAPPPRKTSIPACFRGWFIILY